MKKVFLVVLYKNKICESKTCLFFKNSDILFDNNNILLIWDNSPEKINDYKDVKSYFDSENVYYKYTPENTPLSGIYNNILDKYRFYDAIQIFDQDSYIYKENYNSYINNVLEDNPKINIFLPKIYSEESLYSPGKYFIRGGHFHDLKNGINKNRFYTAIMSGMLIRINWIVENSIRFNEKFKLYCIDTDFICKCRRIDSRFFVMDLDFEHDLSEEKLTISEKEERRKIQVDGAKVIYKNNFICFLLVKIYEFILKLSGRL